MWLQGACTVCCARRPPPPLVPTSLTLPPPSSSPCRDGARLGLWADQRGGWLVRALACIPSRPTIAYCDRAPDAAGAAFRAPQELRLGVAAATSSLDVSLRSARFYSYALPEGDLAGEAAVAGSTDAYFRLAAAAGEVRVVLVSPPTQPAVGTTVAGSSSSPPTTTNCGGGGSVPIPAIAGAAAGVCVVAAAAGVAWRVVRRRRLQRQVAHGDGCVDVLQERRDALAGVLDGMTPLRAASVDDGGLLGL